MHNLCCDNCHSHVARALNIMHYDGSTRSSKQHKNMYTIINISMRIHNHIQCYFTYAFPNKTKNIFLLIFCSWNMVTLCALMLVHGKHVSWCVEITQKHALF